MANYNFKIVDKLILYYLCLFQIFYFHIFNSFDKNVNILLASLSGILALFILYQNLKQKKLNINFNTKLILMSLIIFIFFKFFILAQAYLTFDIDALSVLSKDTGNIFIFTDIIFLLSVIFFILLFEILKINFNRLFLIAFFIAILLLVSTVAALLVATASSKLPEHIGWMNPHIYLFFFNDNVSSKLQHGYIFLLVTIPLIHELYQSKKTIYKTVFVFFGFFFFYLFSKLLLIAFLIFLLMYNLAYYSKENVTLTVRLSLIVFLMIYISSFLFANFTDRKIDLTISLQLKFMKILQLSGLKDNVLSNILNNKQYAVPGIKTFEGMIDYYDSSQQRLDRFLFCTQTGLKYKSYKNFSLIKISNNFKNGKLDENYFNDNYSKKYFLTNCEGSLISIYYQYENFSILVYLGLCLILWYFFKKKDKFGIICFLLLLMISLQHLTLENPVTYFFLAYLLSRKNDQNLKSLA